MQPLAASGILGRSMASLVAGCLKQVGREVVGSGHAEKQGRKNRMHRIGETGRIL